MALNRISTYFRHLMLAWLAVAALMASEHHGRVTANGVPVPGATVTATQGDKKLTTTTDENGTYAFPELADGVWTIQVEMLGFTRLTQDVGVAVDSPSPSWELKVLTLDALKKELAPAPTASASATPAPAPSAAPATTAEAKPPAAQTPKPSAPAPQPSGRNNNAAANGGRGGNNGRPSLRQALANNGGDGFQRLDVNQTGDGQSMAGDMGNNGANADMGQSSDAFVVNGSVSSGLEMPMQNDWMGFGGRGGDGMGFGGPGSFGMGGAPGGDGQPQMDMGGRGGRGGGGPGGPGGGGPGMMGGGGFGGRGGPGGFGGRGGFGGPGGRGGRGPGRGNAAAFGNARRNARMRYNGNLMFTLDNSALDAQQFSLTGQATPKAAYAKFRSSGMFGGPLKIPHLLSGQHTFFTLNYQLARQRNANVVTTLVPTADELAGNFSGAVNPLTGAPLTIYDPRSGNPFPNNIIPQNQLSASALALERYYPLPNFTGNARYNFQEDLTNISNQSNVNTRISETINSKNQMSGNLSWQGGNNTSPGIFLDPANSYARFVDTTNTTGINAGVSWTYHFTTHVINTLRYNFSRSATTGNPYFSNLYNVSALAGIQGNYQQSAFWGPPSLGFSSGFASLNDANKSLTHNNTNQVGESILWVHGTHNMTIGADFRRLDFNQIAQANPRGSFSFTGGITGLAGANGVVNGTGFDYADFLLGFPDTSSIAYGNADKYFRASWADTYFTDDWRLSTKLSLNLGLRWDFQAPVTELYNRLVNLTVGNSFATATAVCGTTPSTGSCTLASQAGLPDSLVRPNYHEIQPRIGFAWRPFTKSQTVVRGGYGIYYNTSVFQPLASRMSQQSPLSYSVTQANSLGSLYTLNNAFLVPATGVTAETFALDPNFQIGYVHYWQLAIQQTLKGGFVVTATYSGNKGTHQVQQFLPNTYPNGVAVSDYPHGFAYETSGANSNYNSLNLQLQRRFRGGLSGNASYVFSKAIDDAEGGLGGRGGGGGGSYAQNWLDLAADRGPSAGQRNHTFNLGMQYSTAMGARGGALLSGWKGAIAKDWNFSSNLTLGTGQLLTPTVANRVTNGTGITGTLRPEYIGGSLSPVLPGYGFNPAAFIQPLPGQWGDAGKGIITGPALFGFNASAGRVFRVDDRRSFDLRFDANNLLNHVVYSNWNTTLGSAQFGLPTGAAAMRTIQATLRFRF